MNNYHRVSHKLFRPEELDGKRLAVCRGGGVMKDCTLRIESFDTDTGTFVLWINWTTLMPPPAGSTVAGIGTWDKESLDQETVNKIVKPPATSYLQQMDYEFAIVGDSQSEFLTKGD